MAENVEFQYQGSLFGHSNWVTCLVTGNPTKDSDGSDILISGSRDKSVMIWKLFKEPEEQKVGIPNKSLRGHNHFISDLALTQDNQHVISSSWDKTLRIWNVNEARSTVTIQGQAKEVFTVAYQQENKFILSAGSDKALSLWNNGGALKHQTKNNNHQDWVSKLAIFNQSNAQQPSYIASVGWDGYLKVWNLNFNILYSFRAHDNNINALSISTNGKYIATGGKDRKLNIWDYVNMTTTSKDFDAGSTINCCAFNPDQQWIAAGTEKGEIRIWDLLVENKQQAQIPFAVLNHHDDLEDGEEKDKKKKQRVECLSLVWTADGKTLYAGFTDGIIRCWKNIKC